MKTGLLCFAFFLLFVLSGVQAKSSLERVDPEADNLQLIIDVDESVRLEISSSDVTTSSVSINTDVDEVVLQRDNTKYTIKKVKAKNTPATTRKPTTPTQKPSNSKNNDASGSFAASSSSVAICLSIVAIACHAIFGEKNSSRSFFTTSVCVLVIILFALCSASFTSASSKSQVTVRVFLPDNIKVTITQKIGRTGAIDVVGDTSAPIRVKSLRFTTETSTELKNFAVESCDNISIVSQGNIIIDGFVTPQSGSCSIFFQSGKQVLATLSDGFLGSFNLYCKETKKNTGSCSANAMGSAVKHLTSGVTTAVDSLTDGATYNATVGDTLCNGATGYNTLTVSGTKINVDFGSSADCSNSSPPPVVGTAIVLPSTSGLPASGSPLPASPSNAPASGSPLPASPSNAPASGSPLPASPSNAPASASPLPASPSNVPASASPSASSLVSSSCRTVNGIQWCYNPSACGESCEEVCNFFGFTITIDDATWFNAQNDLTKCQNIATAFGIGSVNLDSWSYACLEDAPDVHADPTKLIGPLYCSTLSGCPVAHRTATDQLGSGCDVQSRKSICPCQ